LARISQISAAPGAALRNQQRTGTLSFLKRDTRLIAAKCTVEQPVSVGIVGVSSQARNRDEWNDQLQRPRPLRLVSAINRVENRIMPARA
jgi:hypothetical protein